MDFVGTVSQNILSAVFTPAIKCVTGTNNNHLVISTGFYVYAETSRPRVQGERAVLMSPRLTGPYCLRFHFHMLGAAMGSLKAYKNSGSSSTEVFSINGNQGDRWYMAQTSLTGPEQFQVMIKRLFDQIFTTKEVGKTSILLDRKSDLRNIAGKR